MRDPELEAIDRELAQRARGSLPLFQTLAWERVEVRSYEPNWHTDAIAEHLTAVSRGQIRNLIINMPPRHMKSLSCNVFWPSWDWIENSWRAFLFASYRASLSIRDNKKARRLVGSDWFRESYGIDVDAGQDAATRWGIRNGGERLVTSVGGASATGEGADIIVIDDPISADGARSEAVRRECIDWFEDSMRSRLNDPKTGAFVVIMQRLHEDDLTGHLLSSDTGWDHLCLPARYEPDHPYPIRSSIGYRDPRRRAGEILHPERFSAVELDKIARPGSYQDAGQLQQRPAPRGGGMFRREWFRVIPAAPAGCRWVRGWDLAASDEQDSAFTANVRMGRAPDGLFVIDDVRRFRGTAGKVRSRLVATASQDGPEVRGSLPQDPGAAGKAWAAELVKAVAGYPYRASPETGDKVTRAEGLSAQAEIGNVVLVKGDWNKEFLDELTLFPNGKYMDQVDAASRAFMELARRGDFDFYVSGGD